jgi:hypothetical protein
MLVDHTPYPSGILGLGTYFLLAHTKTDGWTDNLNSSFSCFPVFLASCSRLFLLHVVCYQEEIVLLLRSAFESPFFLHAQAFFHVSSALLIFK